MHPCPRWMAIRIPSSPRTPGKDLWLRLQALTFHVSWSLSLRIKTHHKFWRSDRFPRESVLIAIHESPTNLLIAAVNTRPSPPVHSSPLTIFALFSAFVLSGLEHPPRFPYRQASLSSFRKFSYHTGGAHLFSRRHSASFYCLGLASKALIGIVAAFLCSDPSRVPWPSLGGVQGGMGSCIHLLFLAQA